MSFSMVILTSVWLLLTLVDTLEGPPQETLYSSGDINRPRED